jgi:hypothetical protein
MAGRYATSSSQGAPPDSVRKRVEAALGARLLSWSKPDTGLSPAHRFVVVLADGRRVFVKAATTPQTAALLRNERLALASAPPKFTPAVAAWIDDADDAPILVTEALDGHWPASHRGVDWRPGDLERVFAAIRELSGAPAQALTADRSEPSAGWRTILAAPQGFLDLGLCSSDWLDAHGSALAIAEAARERRGEAFVHGDMRSDNICVMDDGVKFVDWSEARRGARDTDLAIFLPTAHLEGGPLPAEVMPDGGAWAAEQSAALALRAIEHDDAPAWLRGVFRRLVRINVDWAIASLGLRPRDA